MCDTVNAEVPEALQTSEQQQTPTKMVVVVVVVVLAWANDVEPT